MGRKAKKRIKIDVGEPGTEKIDDACRNLVLAVTEVVLAKVLKIAREVEGDE